jgi:hypothetical protein
VKRKYRAEFGVNSWNSLSVLTQQGDLPTLTAYEQDFKRHPCHIYMIGRNPRITIDIASLKMNSKTFSGKFLVQKENKFLERPFEMAHEFGDEKLTFESPYPHTVLTARDQNGAIVARHKVPYVVRMGPQGNWDLNDLEIVYVGQSFGVDGARTAPERLQAHETLQAIYAQTVEKSPDKEVWLLLFSFEDQILLTVDGRMKEYETSEAEDDRHVAAVIATPISLQQVVNYTEAALIRYLQPEFNKIYKDTFPNPAHVTYSECYDLDINSVTVVLTTDELATRIWTPHAAVSYRHLASFNLHSSDERLSMFDFFGESWK